MPIRLEQDQSTLLVRKTAFERAGLVRTTFDERLGLTEGEFSSKAT